MAKQKTNNNNKNVKSTTKETSKVTETKEVKKVVIDEPVKVQKPKQKHDIDKKSIQKGVITVLIALVFVLGLFFISNKITDCDLGKFCDKVEENKKDINPLLAEGEVLDETKMKELSEISYADYEKALKNKKTTTVVYLVSDSSYWNQYETPILKSVAYNYDLDIKYLNYDNLTEEEVAEIKKLNDSISKETPALLIVNNKKLVASKTTPLSTSGMVSFFTENKIIKEEK